MKESVKSMKQALLADVQSEQIYALAGHTACPAFIASEVWVRVHYFSRIRKVIDYIGQHPKEPHHLQHMADIGCMNRTSFSKLFKAKSGITLQHFISAFRISRASDMMEISDVSITEIAYEVGFDNLSTFGRSFKKVTGYTPSQYRNGLMRRKGLLVLKPLVV